MQDEQQDVTTDLDGPLDVEWVPRAALEPNSYNPSVSDGVDREVLKNSIIDNSWTQPILVQPDGTIINGESRWFVARHPDIADNPDLTPDGVDAGYVPVVVRDMTDKEAMAATYQHNAATGTHDEQAVVNVVQGTDDVEWALDRLEMEEAELEIQEETGTDVSDIEFDQDTDPGAYTETVNYNVSNPDAVRNRLGRITGDRLVSLARFIVETELYDDVDVPEPEWDNIPDP